MTSIHSPIFTIHALKSYFSKVIKELALNHTIYQLYLVFQIFNIYNLFYPKS